MRRTTGAADAFLRRIRCPIVSTPALSIFTCSSCGSVSSTDAQQRARTDYITAPSNLSVTARGCWRRRHTGTRSRSLAVSASRTVTAGRKVKAEHSGCAFTFTLRPAVTECGKQTARDLTDTRIYPMFTLVTQGPRHRWSLESCLCDSSPATTLRFTYDHGQVISLVVIVGIVNMSYPPHLNVPLWGFLLSLLVCLHHSFQVFLPLLMAAAARPSPLDPRKRRDRTLRSSDQIGEYVPLQGALGSLGTQMIPVPMGLMAPGPTVLLPTVPMVGKHMGPRKDLMGMKNKENDENSGPTTTVFVGNISDKASDMLIRQLLAKCGLVLSWKRVQGASGKLQVMKNNRTSPNHMNKVRITGMTS
ncbi:unnamed protein product [Ranitomeya imitator]|uniref:Uncharacterized protein n=1 Tax=Ranitomeya imitator TaxID=111125 RepID=A0ABN9MA97_9NEOB|nr:unnamed protein product [Ranitomeya imitator]